MSDAMDNAFDAMIIEQINGQSPVKKMQKAHVAKFLRTERQAIKAELREEKKQWSLERKAMTDAGVKDTDSEWVEAKELYELNRRVCLEDLEDLRKMI